jgi:hypothetical protein
MLPCLSRPNCKSKNTFMSETCSDKFNPLFLFFILQYTRIFIHREQLRLRLSWRMSAVSWSYGSTHCVVVDEFLCFWSDSVSQWISLVACNAIANLQWSAIFIIYFPSIYRGHAELRLIWYSDFKRICIRAFSCSLCQSDLRLCVMGSLAWRCVLLDSTGVYAPWWIKSCAPASLSKIRMLDLLIEVVLWRSYFRKLLCLLLR